MFHVERRNGGGVAGDPAPSQDGAPGTPEEVSVEGCWAALRRKLERIGIEDIDAAMEAFRVYLKELDAWSGKANLTAIRDPREIIIKHFVDSLTCLEAASFEASMSVIDVGTGAGFPGIPIRIARPGIKLLLLDASRRRVTFLWAVCRRLGLEDVEVVHGRAESLAREARYRERFDRAVARAVAPLPVVMEYCLPFLAPGGLFVAQIGPGYSGALNAAEEVASILGGSIEGRLSLSLPMDMGERCLLTLRKVCPSPPGYPRRAGIPERRPLP